MTSARSHIIFLVIFYLIVLLLFLFGGYYTIVGKLASILCILSVADLVYKSYKAKNPLFLLIFLFMALYSWPTKLFFFNGQYISGYNMTYTYLTMFWTTMILSFFFIVVNIYIKIPQEKNVKIESFIQDDRLVFWTLLFLSLFLIVIFRTKGNVYIGEEISGSAGAASPVFEYVLILFYSCYVYSGEKKVRLWALFAICTLYFIFTVKSGSRVPFIMLGFLFVAVRYQFMIRIKPFTIFLLLAIWGFNIYGNVRQNPLVLLEGNIWDIINPFMDNSTVLVQGTNESDVVWASERLLLLIEDGELTFGDRLYSLFLYLTSPFPLSLSRSDLYNLTQYKTHIYGTGGGSLAPIVFYVWSGFFGVYFVSRFIAKRFNTLSRLNNKFANYYSVLLVIMVPRWFAYYPMALVKFCLIGAFFMVIINKFHNRKRNKLAEGHCFAQIDNIKRQSI